MQNISDEQTDLSKRKIIIGGLAWFLGLSCLGAKVISSCVREDPTIEKTDDKKPDEYMAYSFNPKKLVPRVIVTGYLKPWSELTGRAKRLYGDDNIDFICTGPFFDPNTKKSVGRICQDGKRIADGNYTGAALLYDSGKLYFADDGAIDWDSDTAVWQKNNYEKKEWHEDSWNDDGFDRSMKLGGLYYILKDGEPVQVSRNVEIRADKERLGIVRCKGDYKILAAEPCSLEKFAGYAQSIGGIDCLGFDGGKSAGFSYRDDGKMKSYFTPEQSIKGILVGVRR
ncbi:MAG: hypothetical protein J4473_05110 [Candidatus Aenigmarchaeota archaeon]|nr:hypothetical protein [Candidatus Aenigmarchaeota archaeon]